MAVSLIVCVIGGILYVVGGESGTDTLFNHLLKVLSELGRLAFFAGLLVFLAGR